MIVERQEGGVKMVFRARVVGGGGAVSAVDVGAVIEGTDAVLVLEG